MSRTKYIWLLLAGTGIGLIIGHYLFAPVLHFIIPRGTKLFVTDVSESFKVTAGFTIVFGFLFGLFPFLCTRFKTKDSKTLSVFLLSFAGLIGAFVYAAVLKVKLSLYISQYPQFFTDSEPMLSMGRIPVARIPLCGIAAMLIVFLSLKLLTKERHQCHSLIEQGESSDKMKNG